MIIENMAMPLSLGFSPWAEAKVTVWRTNRETITDPIKEIARIKFYDVDDEEDYDDIYNNDVVDDGGGKIAYCASVQAASRPKRRFLPPHFTHQRP